MNIAIHEIPDHRNRPSEWGWKAFHQLLVVSLDAGEPWISVYRVGWARIVIGGPRESLVPPK